MMLRFALRALAVRPVKTLVLAFGFGLGVAIMAILLGIGEVILEQAHSPALQGGGDVAVVGAYGSIDSARFVLSSVLASGNMRARVAAMSPSKRSTLYLIAPDKVRTISARGGVPSMESAVGDAETGGRTDWVDAPSDQAWSAPDPGDVLREMDRFHRPPAVAEFASSWAEWLYFNGRSGDGQGSRFYLTFMVGPSTRPGKRSATVRLQLERDGKPSNYSATAEVDEETVLAGAPDIDVGDNHVRLAGLRYRIALALTAEGNRASRLTGNLTLDAVRGRSLPPAVMHGARGWLTGYVVPVLSGTIRGALDIDGQKLSLDNLSGYHDHNWGFWEGVRWQWGQVAHDDLSVVYGRVLPPSSVADPERIPGFLALLGPDGPIGVSTDVSIVEHDASGDPQEVEIRARGPGTPRGPDSPVIPGINVRLVLSVDRTVRSDFALTSAAGALTDFLQLAGVYRVTGQAGDRRIDFTARGAAETFRERPDTVRTGPLPSLK
jgi:hypothetical protein